MRLKELHGDPAGTVAVMIRILSFPLNAGSIWVMFNFLALFTKVSAD
jgi:hypothetical protein